MRKTIIGLLEIGTWIWLFSQIAIGAILGGYYFSTQPYFFDQSGAIFGAIAGLVVGIVTTGLIFLLIDIRLILIDIKVSLEPKKSQATNVPRSAPRFNS
ncbi:MAG: hypothetical protein OXC10_10195 [Rhodospirillaceae bacterium]|nr:hypothetical protein [Rhodospirillaceae bacterium]